MKMYMDFTYNAQKLKAKGCASRRITRTRRVTSIHGITQPNPSVYDVKK